MGLEPARVEEFDVVVVVLVVAVASATEYCRYLKTIAKVDHGVGACSG